MSSIIIVLPKIEDAKKEMENIKDALIKADPKHRTVYEENYKKNAEKKR